MSTRLVVFVMTAFLSLSSVAQSRGHRPKRNRPSWPRPQSTAPVDAEDHHWWQHAVFYEIYPRSFADSNNDGIGDLNGIRSKLDYLKKLGIDAIWISPCYPSPQVDFGYDISDYENIDPMYGTMKDFDLLSAEAKKRGIRIIMDYVPNHTSDKHPWFIDSSSSKNSAHRDWYIWRDGKNGGPPSKLERAVWWISLEARSENQSVLLPLLLSAATRSQLAQPRREKRHVRCNPLVVRTRSLRLSPRRSRYVLRRPQPSRQPSERRKKRLRRSQRRQRLQRQTARGPRHPARPAQSRRRAQRGPHRRNLDTTSTS